MTNRPVLLVAGARPNFMKVVPLLHELDARGIPRVFVHTGQHYDFAMSEALLSDLNSPPADEHLDVGSGSHAVQTARAMERFEPTLLKHRPSWVVVVGDVNSTLACALVSAKLRSELHLQIAHVEAGLRSNDWGMPEEVNRVLTDRLSDLLLTPLASAHENIVHEGLTDSRTVFVGNVMIDSLLSVLPRARELEMPRQFGLESGKYVLATLHRPSNVDDPGRLQLLLEALAVLVRARPVVFPMHPRTKERAERGPLRHLLRGLIVTPPLGYAKMVGLVDGAAATITDSGGVQQETTVLGVPCVTVRQQTEWPITLTEGTNRLATWPLTTESVAFDLEMAVGRSRLSVGEAAPSGWDGRAATRIIDALFADKHVRAQVPRSSADALEHRNRSAQTLLT
jgi:UDP-N-acetylglucosamine 2-epimerase (non-hydrolysing)